MCGELKPHFPRPSHCPAAASSLCTTSPPATTPRPRSTPGACDQGRRAGKAGFGCGRRSACTALHRSHPPHSPTNARRECHPSPLVPQGCSGGVRRAVGRGAARVPVCLRAGCRAGGSGRRPGELRARLPGACAGSTARLRTFLLWYDALCSVLVRRAWLPRWKRQHGRTGSASTAYHAQPCVQVDTFYTTVMALETALNQDTGGRNRASTLKGGTKALQRPVDRMCRGRPRMDGQWGRERASAAGVAPQRRVPPPTRHAAPSPATPPPAAPHHADPCPCRPADPEEEASHRGLERC